MLARQDQRQTQVRELLNSASQMDREESRAMPNVAIEIHFHISGPVVIGTEVASAMLPALMQLIETVKQPVA